jgi:hypothetical protein
MRFPRIQRERAATAPTNGGALRLFDIDDSDGRFVALFT